MAVTRQSRDLGGICGERLKYALRGEFHEKQNSECMLAGLEPASHECPLEKPNLPQHKPGSPWNNWPLPTTSPIQGPFFSSAKS